MACYRNQAKKRAERNNHYGFAMDPMLPSRPLRDHSDHCVLLYSRFSLLLDLAGTAIDKELDTGDVATVIRGKKDGDLGRFVGAGPASKGY